MAQYIEYFLKKSKVDKSYRTILEEDREDTSMLYFCRSCNTPQIMEWIFIEWAHPWVFPIALAPTVLQGGFLNTEMNYSTYNSSLNQRKQPHHNWKFNLAFGCSTRQMNLCSTHNQKKNNRASFTQQCGTHFPLDKN